MACAILLSVTGACAEEPDVELLIKDRRCPPQQSRCRPDAGAPADAGAADASLDGSVAEPDAGVDEADGPDGFAAVAARGLATTTGAGEGAPVVTVTTREQFNSAAGGTTPRVVQVSGTISGNMAIGSNKTIVGLPGGTLRGSVQINDAQNVIVRDLTIVGYNCSDNPDCGSGLDALVVRRSHHLWFDHLDISDGSDGNFDLRDGDYVTISWCKFHYSPARVSTSVGDPHRFSNGLASDALVPFYVTMHHNWWADRVFSRMPRVSYGHVHLYNNLMASQGNESCVHVAGDANIFVEANHFLNVDDPVKIGSTVTTASVVVSSGNLYENTTGQRADHGDPATVMVPPYDYTLEPVGALRTSITTGAGPRH
jgi:pectate lyase